MNPSHNPMDLTSRTILVTGASSGIGKAASVLLSRLGAKVVLAGRDMARLEETRQAMAGDGHEISAYNLSEVRGIVDWLKSVAVRVGPLHGLVHSAGLHSSLPLKCMSIEEASAVMQANWLTAMELAKGFRQRQVRSLSARIVFLSSVAGMTGQPALSAYSSSKGALIALARSLAIELAGEGITVNCVAPAMVKSKMTEEFARRLTPEQYERIKASHPLGFGEPEDVASAIAFLLADTGRWITGSTLVVDGGYTAQ